MNNKVAFSIPAGLIVCRLGLQKLLTRIDWVISKHTRQIFMTSCDTTFRSILTFPWVELGGKVHITCAKTGYNASVTFHTKPFYGGKLHRVTGEVKNTSTGRVICKVNGEWNGKIELSFTSHQVCLISF